MSNPSALAAVTTTPAPRHDDGETRLYGWRLIVARSLVFSIIAIAVGLCLLSAPNLVARLATPCADVLQNCMITPQQVTHLAQFGVSSGAVAVGMAVLSWLAVLLSGGVAAILLWRRSDDWMALLVALALVLLPVGYMPVLLGLDSMWQVPASLISGAGVFVLLLLPALFPSGRFVPRWLWLAPLAGAWVAFGPDFGPEDAVIGTVSYLLYLVSIVCLIGGQIYRYRRISTPLQRQQTKWAASGLLLAIVLNQVFWLPAALIPVIMPSAPQEDSLYLLLFPLDSFLMVSVVAICFGVAILRFRLYDIDTLIRRTLIYGSLTAILVGAYLALALGAQAALHALTGRYSDEPLIIVATTLLIAALFNPLRKRIQRTIDRRFYRRTYDAAKTLAAFGARLRTQTDLPQLTEHLVGVVEETMQPTHIGLWLTPLTPKEAQHDEEG